MPSVAGVLTEVFEPSHAHQAPAHRVEQAIEKICALGCKAVHGVVSQLEAGLFVAETAGLTHFEKQRVAEELKDVMSVYAYRCTIDGV